MLGKQSRKVEEALPIGTNSVKKRNFLGNRFSNNYSADGNVY